MTVVDRTRARLGLAVVCAAHFLIGADGLSVAIALPHLQRTFDAELIDVQWTLTGYGVVFGSFMLLGGRLGDLYGRRRLLTGGMLLFAAGSLLAGLAPVLGLLITGRVLQGLGAAAAVPAALALIGSLYPPGPARTRALSLLAAMVTVGVMSGLVIGGMVIGWLGWRWLFLLMAVPSLIAAAGAPHVLPETPALRDTKPDVLGAVLVSTGLIALLYGLTSIEHNGLVAARPLLSLAIGAALLTGFVAWERRTPVPLLRFDILRVRSLRAGSFGIGANGVAFTSTVYAGTLYLQDGLGYTPIQAAFAVLPIDAVAFVIALIAAPIVRRSPRTILSACFLLTAAALLWLARTPVPANYLTDLMAPLVILGVSLTLVFIITTHQAVADVHPDDKGIASGIYETANHLLGGAVGVAVYATIVATVANETGDPNGYRAAFLASAGLVIAFGCAAVTLSAPRGRTP
ncbi:MFS transporter [Actinophytocola algeriensis]|uniref:EmrB/QacA subfamily drug resistance transporter n=1 Tax=Actinophytocola algeriensis TaxID=1768010 RepID=A0A7W7Q321_9PSEU|nr:MFS transporter [Actinophytocola algeriensis]MBB4906096.1 EmrB/QacA subfamily drug resistance transporter [Actinophytocola algeriensis]MBE1472219.1 EmrB/QacA subfamily drug resistance transporter [Actinophytocola algeriensis]